MKIEGNRRESGIPLRFKSATFASFVATSKAQAGALECLRRYEREFEQHRSRGSCLVLCGKPGTGKTHLATALCAALIETGFSARYRLTPDLLREIKASWSSTAESTEEQVLKRIWSADLLVIDEVGVQFGSETETRYFFEIIDGRYRNRRPTVVVTNLNIEQLGKLLGERTMDRLLEHGSKVVVFDWESHRQKSPVAGPQPKVQ